jgi:hypothetical protein
VVHRRDGRRQRVCLVCKEEWALLAEVARILATPSQPQPPPSTEWPRPRPPDPPKPKTNGNGNRGGNMGAIVDMVEPDCITLGEYRRLTGRAS